MKDESNLITWVNGYQIFCWHHLIEVDVIDNIMLNYVYKKEYSKISQSLDLSLIIDVEFYIILDYYNMNNTPIRNEVP